MSAATETRSELLSELRSLAEKLPLPQPSSGHPYIPQIVACRDDFLWALEAAEARPAALDVLADLIDGDAMAAIDPAASPELLEAWERLRALPLPQGQHPYLGEIMSALGALRLLLVALGRTAATHP